MKKKLLGLMLALTCVTVLTVGCQEKTTTKKVVTKKEQTAKEKAKEKKEETIKDGKIFFANQADTKIHETANEASAVIETVGLNDELMTIGKEANGFRKVTINGKQGFVATAYLATEKITVAAVIPTPDPATVAPTAPVTPTPAPTTVTNKPATTTTKPATTTTKPSTPAPAPTPTPTPAPAPANCPYPLLTLTTYDGHYGFFYDMQASDGSKTSAMMEEVRLAYSEIDPATNVIIKYPSSAKTVYNIGYYSDVKQLVFYYAIK